MYTDVSVQATETQDHLRGITTADLAKIQKHILNGNTLQSPYLILAADANQNGQITTHDIALLRALLLGRISSLPGGDAYLFIDKNYKFINAIFPFDEYKNNKNISIRAVTNDTKLDWMAIKLGDVNASATFSSFNNFKNSVAFNVETDGAYINIRTESEINLQSLQFGLIINHISNTFLEFTDSDLPGLQAEHFRMENNRMRLSFHTADDVLLKKGSLIARLKVKNQIPSTSVILDDSFISELFHADGKFSHIKLTDLIAQNQSFHSACEGVLQLEVLSLEGKLINVMNFMLDDENQTIELPMTAFSYEGVYVLKCKWNNNTRVHRIIINK
jgi:hypothetical protein